MREFEKNLALIQMSEEDVFERHRATGATTLMALRGILTSILVYLKSRVQPVPNPSNVLSSSELRRIQHPKLEKLTRATCSNPLNFFDPHSLDHPTENLPRVFFIRRCLMCFCSFSGNQASAHCVRSARGARASHAIRGGLVSTKKINNQKEI